MTSSEICHFIEVRGHELSSDEILLLLDVDKHPEISSFEYRNGWYKMWDFVGNEYSFSKRNWK